MEISILDTGENSALENMKIDEVLLKNLESIEKPKLHLYSWMGDCATYGHFAKPENLLNMEEVKKKKLQLAKRVTGGGMTFHFSDYAFSFFMPKGHPYFSENTLENYRFVNQFVLKAIEEYIDEKENLNFFDPCKINDPMAQQFCMAKPTKYDVLHKGKKVGGAAQRKTSNGYLHHGTISIAMPDLNYLKEILLSEEIYDAICQNSFYLVNNHLDKERLNSFREKIEKKLIESFLNFV
jgi:lipoate---protein ligase